MATLGYLGPEGTNSHEAAEQFATQIGALNLLPYHSIAQVIQNAADSKTDSNAVRMACVPLENSVQGSVTVTWDTLGKLVRQASAESRPAPLIHASLTLDISHRLLTIQDLPISEIRTVYSHPQALAQCQEWLEQVLPHASQVPVASTAEAAKYVKALADPTSAAIAPLLAGRSYGLYCHEVFIQNSSQNRTRFGLVVAGQERVQLAQPVPSDAVWTLALCLVGVANEPGGLFATLEPFRAHGLNLSRIESRPVGHRLGEYLFYIDVEWPYGPTAPEDSAAWREIRAQFTKSHAEAFVLGCFPELSIDAME